MRRRLPSLGDVVVVVKSAKTGIAPGLFQSRLGRVVEMHDDGILVHFSAPSVDFRFQVDNLEVFNIARHIRTTEGG